MPATLRMRYTRMLPALLAAVLAATLFTITPPAEAMTRAQRVAVALDVVRAQKGDPYRYGAAGPNAFDCSGLLYYSYRRAGFTNIPRTSSQQAAAARRITRSAMRKGDFVFFTSGGHVYHAAVFAGWAYGRRYIIHASRPGTPVKRDRIWTNSWFPATLR
jgi:cell wall-associated NlpC family hydrolase